MNLKREGVYGFLKIIYQTVSLAADASAAGDGGIRWHEERDKSPKYSQEQIQEYTAMWVIFSLSVNM